MRRIARGFTLVELLVVLVILGIMISLASLTMHPLSDARRVQAAASELKRELAVLSQQAMLTNTVFGLEVSAHAWRPYRLMSDASGHFSWQACTPSICQGLGPELKSTVLLKLLPLRLKKIVISPSGDLTPATIEMSDLNGHSRLRIQISPAGVK
jgi:type II secretion system protein H